MRTPRTIFGFILVSLFVFVIGCFGAQFLWSTTHHRYDSPETGLYHGFISVILEDWDSGTFISFQGQTPQRWYWQEPTNFAYAKLSLKCRAYVTNSFVEKEVVLDLPTFSYPASGGNEVLTREVLAGWLFGQKNTGDTTNIAQINEIFRYLESAGRGTLPQPNHHGYRFNPSPKEPLRVNIQHFLLGLGVGSYVYVWIVIWMIISAFCVGFLLKGLKRKLNTNGPIAT